MKIDKRIMMTIIAIVITSTIIPGCLDQSGDLSEISLSAGSTENPKYILAKYYQENQISVYPNAAQYILPLDVETVANFDNIDNLFNLSTEQKDILSQNGFVVIDFQKEDDITSPYSYLINREIPIFITSDTLLHLYHIQFDEILKNIEEREFFDKILLISKALFDKAKSDYEKCTDVTLKEALRRNIAFTAVGLSLLQTPTDEYNGSEEIKTVEFSIPDYVKNEIDQELAFIEDQDGFHDSPLFIYREDYSQYKPRGHYTQSEKLKRYFKAMMWYGRMSFLIKGGDPNCQYCDFLISLEDSNIQTIQASLLSTDLSTTEIENNSTDELWTRIYTVTSFFVGVADDLTPYEYLDSLKDVFGSNFNATDLTDENKLNSLKLKLAQLRNPEIYGGTGEIIIAKPPGVPFTIEDLNETLNKTKGMRLMGQRFIPDSYIFQQLVFPAVDNFTGSGKPFTMEYTDGGPARAFPRGLDVMATLGSERALEILDQEGDTAYENYIDQLYTLKENISKFNLTTWNRNLYFSWIYTLQPLLQDYNSDYPTFMNTASWLDKQLHTALASWTELRHDTILYAKQSYTPIKFTAIEPEEPKVPGYVEPIPEFYSRLLSLTQMTRDGLTDLQVLDSQESFRLISLENILSRLLNITTKELENEALSESDYRFISDFGENLDDTISGVDEQGKQTTIVADVHTDTNTQQVLEEGIGYVDLILVAYKNPDGSINVGAGPVFSYYEFKQEMDDRLTDEEWEQMLLDDQAPTRPLWTKSFISE